MTNERTNKERNRIQNILPISRYFNIFPISSVFKLQRVDQNAIQTPRMAITIIDITPTNLREEKDFKNIKGVTVITNTTIMEF